MQNRKQHRVRLRGTGNKTVGDDSVGTVVRAVPRKPVLAAFVGQLHKDTTPEELSAYLTAEGMKGVIRGKLKPKNSQSFHTAAFYVLCCLDSTAFTMKAVGKKQSSCRTVYISNSFVNTFHHGCHKLSQMTTGLPGQAVRPGKPAEQPGSSVAGFRVH